jgi:hypothetical protein
LGRDEEDEAEAAATMVTDEVAMLPPFFDSFDFDP